MLFYIKMVETKSPLQKYRLKGNPVVDVPVVGNLVYDDLGKLFLARLNEGFRGNNQIAFIDRIEKNRQIPFSSIPRNLFADQVIREETGNIYVLSPFEFVRYWNSLNKRSETYADSSAVSVFPNKGPNETLRRRVLEILGINITKIPLLVVGLGVEKADNEYGFTFIETPYLRPIEAPFLTEDQRVKYDPKKDTLVPSEDDTGVQIYVPKDQSGLRRACRGGVVYLSFRDVDLLNSSSDGRVPVIQDPKGRAENLGALINH